MKKFRREHLNRAIGVRQSFSPYGGNVGFDQFFGQLNTEAGLSDVYNGSTAYGASLTRIQIVNNVEDDLAQARDLYAFLAVFAPVERFRADSDYSVLLCSQPEEPNPADPSNSGQILAPVIDWCDFRARLTSECA